jgi:hypothetical protein
MAPRVRLGGEAEDSGRVEDIRHAMRHQGMTEWVAFGNIVPGHAGHRIRSTMRQVNGGVPKTHTCEGGGQ